MTNKFDIYNNDSFKRIIHSSRQFEESNEGSYYKNILCLKNTSATIKRPTLEKAYHNLKSYISNSFEEVAENNLKKLCVLPKNHTGKCTSNPITEMLLKNKTTEKIKNKIELSIYNTPGADDYIIKNRASRLFPIVVTKEQVRKIKNKNTKLKAAILLSEFTTPFCAATAYFDWMVYLINVRDMTNHLKQKSIYLKLYNRIDLFESHKQYLQKYFIKHHRIAFNNRGNTICVVTRKEINIKDIGDPDRDVRLNSSHEDVQMGHLIPRNENLITIRGLNLSVMTREGNRIIGEHVLFDNHWITILKEIVSIY